MLQFVLTHWYLIALSAGLLLPVLLCLLMKRRQTQRRNREMARFKRRNEALAEALKNPQMESGGSTPDVPVEVSWDENKLQAKRKKDRSPMAELVEISAYSRRKYIYRLAEPVRIGSGKGCGLELFREGVEAVHCEILMNRDRPCVRSLGTAKTVLLRGKSSALVGREGVYLKSGDRLQLGSAEIQFRLFYG